MKVNGKSLKTELHDVSVWKVTVMSQDPKGLNMRVTSLQKPPELLGCSFYLLTVLLHVRTEVKSFSNKIKQYVTEMLQNEVL